MQEKEMVNDALNHINAGLTSYASMIAQTENQELRTTLKQMRDQAEKSQYELYNLAKSLNYYTPSQQASQDEIMKVKSEVSGGSMSSGSMSSSMSSGSMSSNMSSGSSMSSSSMGSGMSSGSMGSSSSSKSMGSSNSSGSMGSSNSSSSMGSSNSSKSMGSSNSSSSMGSSSSGKSMGKSMASSAGSQDLTKDLTQKQKQDLQAPPKKDSFR